MRFLTSKKFRFAAASVAFGALPLAGFAAATGDVGINLSVTGPLPELTTAALGDTVRFVNVDGANTYVVASEKGAFVSPPIPQGQAFAYTLTTSGTFGYKQFGGAKSEYRGEIIVRKEGEVSLGTSKEAIPFGSSVVLSGTAAPVGFPVTIQRRLPGQKLWFNLTSVTPSADGTFSTTVQPTIATDYRAALFGNEILSPDIKVLVTPKLKIVQAIPRKVEPGSAVTVSAQITPRNAATSMDLARYDKEHVRWVKVATSPVAPIGGSAKFAWKPPYGRSLLRVQISKNRLRPGFSVTNSTWVLVDGGKAPPPEPEPEKKKKKKKRNRNR